MEIKQLRTFLAVANARSFLGAAANLYISRQAVSKTIASWKMSSILNYLCATKTVL